MIFPITTHDATTQQLPSPNRLAPRSSTSELPWLGINVLCGTITGLLIYKSDTLAQLAIRLLT